MYYRNTLPHKGDIVFVKYRSSTDDGIYVELVEYDNMEGFILITEIAKYKVRPDKVFKMKKMYPCYVLDVNPDKKTVDLSYKKIKEEQHKILEHKFTIIQKFRKILDDLLTIKLIDDDILTSNTFDMLINHETLIETDDPSNETIEHLYDKILKEPSLFFCGKDIEQPIIDQYVNFIKSKVTDSGVEFYKEFKLTVLERNAPEKIKSICGVVKCDDDSDTQLRLLYTSPQYRICISAPTEKIGMDTLTSAETLLKSEIEKYDAVSDFTIPIVYTKKRSIKYD